MSQYIIQFQQGVDTSLIKLLKFNSLCFPRKIRKVTDPGNKRQAHKESNMWKTENTIPINCPSGGAHVEGVGTLNWEHPETSTIDIICCCRSSCLSVCLQSG